MERSGVIEQEPQGLGRLQRGFRPVRRMLPQSLSSALRSVLTAILTPLIWSIRSGHLRSSLARKAMTSRGNPLPWYTYPAITFLQDRDFQGRRVLEFGGGQSTRWWASRAAEVVALEGDPVWCEHLAGSVPGNATVRSVAMSDRDANVAAVRTALHCEDSGSFDVVVIDGLYRSDMVPIACRMLADDGILICDDAEGYGITEALANEGLQRVDFHGHAPGVVSPHCTAIYFRPGSFVFDASLPISRDPREP